MPKLRPTPEQMECNRFSDFVRGELKRQGKKHSDLADELNLSQPTVTQKINGKVVWTLPEIIQTVDYLNTEYTIGG